MEWRFSRGFNLLTVDNLHVSHVVVFAFSGSSASLQFTLIARNYVGKSKFTHI